MTGSYRAKAKGKGEEVTHDELLGKLGLSSGASPAEQGGYPSGGQGGSGGQKKGFLSKLWGGTNVYNYGASKETKEGTKGRLLMVIFILAIIMTSVYIFYWGSSAGGQRSVARLGLVWDQYNPWSLYTKELGRAQDIGSLWSAEANDTSVKKGVLFETFKVLGSEELPQGSPVYIAYGLKLAGTQVSRLPLTLGCKIKDKNIPGKISPSNPVYITGRRITEEIRCMFPAEITEMLKDTVQVEGTVNFPFKTENAVLKVYFITEQMEQSLYSAVDEVDFFEYMGINENQPLRTTYNGEPMEIGMGVSTENIQPVVVREGYNPIVGITLNNRWDGKMLNLTKLKLVLPKELTINQELSQSPNYLCPFEQKRQGRITNEYEAVESMIQGISLESGRIRNFECRLNVAPDMIGDADYVTKDYRADAEYVYELPAQTAVLTIKNVNAEKTTISGTASEAAAGATETLVDTAEGAGDTLSEVI